MLCALDTEAPSRTKVWPHKTTIEKSMAARRIFGKELVKNDRNEADHRRNLIEDEKHRAQPHQSVVLSKE
jgi:hypothetical protein